MPLYKYISKRKRKRSDSVLWQKPLHQQKSQKGKVTTQTTPQKSSITKRLRTDLGQSVGVTTVTQLVWLTWFTGPTFPLPTTDVLSKYIYSDIRIGQAMLRQYGSELRSDGWRSPDLQSEGTKIRTSSPLRRFGQGPSYSPNRLVSQKCNAPGKVCTRL